MSPLAMTLIVGSVLGAPPTTPPVCLAPASAQIASTDPAQASAAVTELVKSYLTGPTLSVTPLTARLASQAREEAHRASCKFVLFVTVKQERKRSSGVLGQIVGRAARDAAWEANVRASTAATRVATMGAVGAARAAADIAATTKTRDELELSYTLESENGAVLKQSTAKRKATSDGEDLLTPLVEHAAEEIAAIVAK